MSDRDREIEDDEELALPEDEQEGEEPGQLDNESGDEAEAGQEPEDAQAQERVGRAGKRIQALRREAQEASERASRLERELNEERSRRQQYQQPQGETEAQERERLALMTSEERFEYKLNKAREENSRQIRIMQFQSLDMADKTAYAAKAAVNPKYKKYEAEVEALLQAERRAGRGFDLSRETVLKFHLGNKLLSNEDKPRQEKQGKENIRRQQARADSGRSDVSSSRQRAGTGDTLEDLERRLRGVNI